jgi:hypothetical protein
MTRSKGKLVLTTLKATLEFLRRILVVLDRRIEMIKKIAEVLEPDSHLGVA